MHITDKGLASRMYIELFQINKKRKNNVIEKWARNTEALQRRCYSNDQEMHEKELNLISYDRNAKRNHHKETPLHTQKNRWCNHSVKMESNGPLRYCWWVWLLAKPHLEN